MLSWGSDNAPVPRKRLLLEFGKSRCEERISRAQIYSKIYKNWEKVIDL